MGILDALFGQQQPQQAAPPGPPSPGIGDRLMAGVQGYLNSPSEFGGWGNFISGVATGNRTDPAGAQQAAVSGQLQQLIKDGRIDATTARFLAANPKSWEELSKAMINQPVTVGPSGDVLTSGPFGTLTPRGAFPVSDQTQLTDPTTGEKRPGYSIRPSLFNPQGRVADPTATAQPAAAPQAPIPQASPMPAQPAGYGGSPANNPNLRPMGQPAMPQRPTRLITEASPQATEERQGIGKALAEEYKAITTKASSATARLGTLQRMAQLSPEAFGGAAGPAQQFARSLLTSFGLPSDAVKAGEEFTALTNKLVLDANNGSLGAGVSNADVHFLMNINPNLAQSPAGRAQIIETLTKLARRDIEVAREAQRYRSQTGSMDGFQVHISEWANRNPLFSGASAQPRAASFNDRFSTADAPGSPGIRILSVR